ncbi:MAG: TonB-dependent receptor, partial [Maricaulaceae bacterium]
NSLPNSPENKIAFNTTYRWNFDRGTLVASGSYFWRDSQYSNIFNRAVREVPDYEQFDARVSWVDADDRYTIIAFARNLTDELGFDSVSAQERSNGSFALDITPTPPRTYGVELQLRYH